MFRRPIAHPLRSAALGLALTGVLGGCSSLSENTRMPEASEYNSDSRRDSVRGRLGGTDGIVIFGTGRSTRGTAAGDVSGAGIGVNAFLWRATLDTLSFMPLALASACWRAARAWATMSGSPARTSTTPAVGGIASAAGLVVAMAS